MCNQFNILAAAVPAFTIKKIKTTKDVLDKKAPITGTATCT